MSRTGNAPNCRNPFTQAIRNDPKHYESYFGRGSCYDSLEQFRKAYTDFNRALALCRDYPELWYARADVARGHAARAATLLTKLAAAPGAGALAQATLGEALLADRRPADAEAAQKAAAIIAGVAAYMKSARAKPDFGLHEWNALLRVIDGKGTDYRR